MESSSLKLGVGEIIYKRGARDDHFVKTLQWYFALQVEFLAPDEALEDAKNKGRKSIQICKDSLSFVQIFKDLLHPISECLMFLVAVLVLQLLQLSSHIKGTEIACNGTLQSCI